MTEDHGLKLSNQIDIFWKISGRSTAVLYTYTMVLHCKKTFGLNLSPQPRSGAVPNLPKSESRTGGVDRR